MTGKKGKLVYTDNRPSEGSYYSIKSLLLFGQFHMEEILCKSFKQYGQEKTCGTTAIQDKILPVPVVGRFFFATDKRYI